MKKTSGSIDLSQELQATEDSINQILKGTKMSEATQTETSTPVKTSVKKAPAKKAPAKKAAPKKAAPAKKKAAPVSRERTAPDGHTLLVDICTKAKVEPTIARRRLRDAGITRKEGSQYSWPAGQLDKITKIIKGAE